MRRGLLLAVVVVSACGRPSPPHTAPGSPPAGTTISVVATTDVHGHIESIPWLAGHVENLRAARRAEGGDVLLVDAGDMWQGTLESNLGEGAAVVRAYNALGYHAVTLGNHEFDFGPVGPKTVPRGPGDNPTGNIERRARQARFPFLAANLVSRANVPWTPRNIQPSTLITIAGVRVGLVGVTTMATPYSTDPRNLVKLRVTPLRDVVEREATRLRAAGATVVVVLAHAGGSCDRFIDPDDLTACRTQGEIFQVAQALPPGLVDVIAAGHAHGGIAHRVNGIAIVEAYQLGRAFSRVDLQIDGNGRAVDVRIHPPRPLCDGAALRDVGSWAADACNPPPYEGRPVRHDARMVHVLRGDIAAADRRRQQPLGVVAARAYPHSSRDESPASHLVVDLLRASHPEADVAIYIATGTRAGLPAGPITYGGIYALIPFDSVVATGRLPAWTISNAIVSGVTRGPIPIVSGIEAEVTCVAGTPTAALVRDGTPIAPDTPLSVVTSEYLSAGGSAYFPDMERLFTLQLDRPMRESVVTVLASQEEGLRTGRIGGHDPGRRRIRVPDGRYPVRCDTPTQ